MHKTTRIKQRRTELNKLILIVAIVEPIIALPQVIEIYTNKNSGSVSLLSWTLYSFAAIAWLAYGVSIKDRPLIITSLLNVVMEIAVVVAIIVY